MQPLKEPCPNPERYSHYPGSVTRSSKGHSTVWSSQLLEDDGEHGKKSEFHEQTHCFVLLVVFVSVLQRNRKNIILYTCIYIHMCIYGYTHTHTYTHICMYIDAVVKNLPSNAGDARDSGSIPRLRRSPGGGNDYLLWCSCLENPMD